MSATLLHNETHSRIAMYHLSNAVRTDQTLAYLVMIAKIELI